VPDTYRTVEDVRERFEAMYRRCEEPVLAYALRRAPGDIARDAAAEAFVAAWRRFHELPSDPLPWLIGATRKALANQRRASTRQTRLAERLAQQPDPAVEADTGADLAVRRAFGRLTTTDRETLALIAWDGLTPAQAARSLGCSPVAFRVRLHRARRRLEHALRRETDLARPALTVKEAS
jgi:RNA polymerase sigma-70 factor, ECF subfamily